MPSDSLGSDAAGAERRLGDAESGLTPREHEVLELLANGLPQGRIADQLVISPRTVATHIQRILSKLEVHSRAEAVAVAHQRHLIRA